MGYARVCPCNRRETAEERRQGKFCTINTSLGICWCQIIISILSCDCNFHCALEHSFCSSVLTGSEGIMILCDRAISSWAEPVLRGCSLLQAMTFTLLEPLIVNSCRGSAGTRMAKVWSWNLDLSCSLSTSSMESRWEKRKNNLPWARQAI